MTNLKVDWISCDVCPVSAQPKHLLVKTENGDAGWLYDGDKVTCPQCKSRGVIRTDDGLAWAEMEGKV